ncbi:MAG: hypothetical protein RIT45_91 [Pseudomonadota bacterium]|jgi:1-acyl-sn-glycerol-3-phosphate acyltransferase
MQPLRLAQQHDENGAFAEAAAQYRAAYELDPQPETLRLAARAASQAGLHADAEHDLRRYLALPGVSEQGKRDAERELAAIVARGGGPLDRGLLPVALTRLVAGWAFSAVYIPGLVLRCLSIPDDRRTDVGPRWVRRWGRTMARIGGVDVRFTPAAAAALAERTPRVLVFNHGSTLDVLTGAALLPPGGVLVVKQEMRSIPLLGTGCAALGSIFLDRGDRAAAYASLQEAAERIRRQQLQPLIAPEGTRSTDGTLGRFKLGAFHLAALADVPILPIVLRDHVAIWPHGQLTPARGVATIDVLEPIVVRPDDDLAAAADALRERYRVALAGEGTDPPR